MTTSYQQEIKGISRERLISHAIDHLTTKRSNSYLVTKEHVERITSRFNTKFFSTIREGNIDFKNKYNWLFFGEKNSWFSFYDGIAKEKTAAELKVLYLSGPEPENDIEVLCNHGISLHNIWAIEGDKLSFQNALARLSEAQLQIKLHRGSLEEFFELTNHEFDIIYFDACTPIISPKASPLETLKQIFVNKRLSPLSALITNFSEPGENYNWGDIMACWFSTKIDQGLPYCDRHCGLDTMRAAELAKYSTFINQHRAEYYDYFLTNFIPCLASEIVPIWQICSLSSIQNNYLLNDQQLIPLLSKIKNPEISGDNIHDILGQIPHYLLSVDSYPLLNWAKAIKDFLPKDHQLNSFINSKRKRINIEDAMYIGSILKNFEEAASRLRTFIQDICSDNLKRILATVDFFDRQLHISCDIPMKNLLVELLIGLYGYPYVANASKVLALEYTAKERRMYSNVFIFDQCRYLYDYPPTVDLFEDFFKGIHRQTIIKACIDGITRNHVTLNTEFFKWGFVEGMYDEFGYGELKERESLN